MLINFNQLKTFYNALEQKMKSFRGNWEQNNPNASDYIKNKPLEVTSENVMEWMCEEGAIVPLASVDGEVYTTEDGEVIIL